MHMRRAASGIAPPLNRGVRRMFSRIAAFWFALFAAGAVASAISVFGGADFSLGGLPGSGRSFAYFTAVNAVASFLLALGYLVGAKLSGTMLSVSSSLLAGVLLWLAINVSARVLLSAGVHPMPLNIVTFVAAFLLAITAPWIVAFWRGGRA
jgi:hypothetical protein